jgi:putative hydrolase of the HAD superfamily
MQQTSRYDAVIFDLFGTLVDNFAIEQFNMMLAVMARELDAEREDFIRHWIGTYRERASGVFTSTEENIFHIAGAMQLQPSPEQIEKARILRWQFTQKWLKPRSDAIETLAQLRQMGLKIGLVSDCSSEVPGIWSATPFAPFFDVTIFSCSVSMCKPDPRIYALACEQLAVDPTRCLYVGDGGSQELSGAHRAGMHPVMIRAAYEKDVDVYRAGAEEWDGETISTLRQVIDYI